MRLLLLLALAAPSLLPAQRLHKMPARSTGELYVPSVSPKVHPGDTIQLAGKYSYIFLNNVQGTPEKPVIIHAPRPVQVGDKATNFGIVIQGQYWKLIGYGHLQVYNPATSLNVLLSLGNSQHASVEGLVLRHGHVGIMARPDTSGERTDLHIARCKLRELRGTRTGGRSTGILIGTDNPKTADTSWYTGIRIEDVTMTDLHGVGIYLKACREADISRTRIDSFGRAQLPFQDMAVLVGPGSQATLTDCQLTNGPGSGVVWKGLGQLLLRQCKLTATAQGNKADALYAEPTTGKKASLILLNVQITGANGYGVHIAGGARLQQRQLQIAKCRLGKWLGATPVALQ